MPDRHTDANDRMLPARRPEPGREARERELVTVRARADIFRSRLDESRDRFRDALEQFNARTTELSPIHRVRLYPYRWVVGGFGVGLLIGWLTSSSGARID